MSVMTAISAFTHRAARRSARLQLLAYSGAITGLLLAIAAWVVARADGPPGGHCDYDFCPHLPSIQWSVLELADLLGVALLALGLLVIAPAAIAAAVAAERRAGTLDQLRTTPLSPLGLTFGMVLGAPSRIYFLLAGPLALHIACGLGGVIPLETLIASVAVLVSGGIASVLVGLAVALAPRQETGGAFVALGVAAVLGACGLAGFVLAADPHLVGWAFLHPGGGLDATLLQHDGLWRRLQASPWRLEHFWESGFVADLALAPLLSCASSLALAIVLAAACCRKLAAPHLALFSKTQALVLFTGIAAGVILPLRHLTHYGADLAKVGLALALLLLPVATLLALFATPAFESWALALRRAMPVRWHHDDAPPHRTFFAMGLVLVALVATLSDGGGFPSERDLPAILWALVIAASLPVFVLFLATRFTTTAARWAFGAAIVIHLIAQGVAVALVVDRASSFDLLFVQAAAGVGIALPAWVAIRQRMLRRSILAAAPI